MNAEFRDPLDVRGVLTAIIPENENYRFIWTDYETGNIEHTLWDTVPSEMYDKRPLSRAFLGKYEIEKKRDCERTLTYGPAAGGIGEAGAFKIRTCGERIDALIPYAGFKIRPLLKQAIGKEPWAALPFIERITGQFSVSYATLFYSLVYGRSCGWYLLLAKELERIHNHIWVMHKLAADASQKVGSAHLAAITEQFLRLNNRVLGHRYGMNFLRTGPRGYRNFQRDIRYLKQWFLDISEEFSMSRIFIDRLQTTGTLKKDDIVRHDITGIPARSSGLMRDARKIGVLKDLYGDMVIPTETHGDSLLRFLLRVKEVEMSIEMIESIELRGCRIEKEAPIEGFREGLVEAPPGDIYMGVMVSNGKIKEIIIRPPSLVLYHAFSVAIRDNVFTDLPFTLDSFGAYFSDADIFGRWA